MDHTLNGRYGTFAHLTAEKARLYRRVLEVFAQAKARFVLHLRPSDVLAAMENPPDQADLEQALRQLRDWGNLSADPDTADVATVEEFYRARYLYRLTSAGEATERALTAFEEGLRKPGELQTAALGDIRDLLRELHSHAAADPVVVPDQAKVHLALRSLWHRFEELTDRAQLFVANLQRAVELYSSDIDALIGYKDLLIDYLEKFVGELVIAQAHIAELLRELDASGVDRLLDLAAERELSDALANSENVIAAARREWRARWTGLAGWFLPDGGRRAQAELLRASARAAIPALLQAISEINERRLSRSDRAGDLRTLARWFARCNSDADAHCLWRAAFGLSPARHWTVDQETLAERDQHPVAPSTSWLDAPPMRIHPRLRRTGRIVRRGRVNAVIDRSAEKALLARMAAEESAQTAAARLRLTTSGATRLSQLGFLDPTAFNLFLDLLGSALAAAVRRRAPAVATAADGVLEIELIPIGDGVIATIETKAGALSGPDHHITIRETVAARLSE